MENVRKLRYNGPHLEVELEVTGEDGLPLLVKRGETVEILDGDYADRLLEGGNTVGEKGKPVEVTDPELSPWSEIGTTKTKAKGAS